MNKDLFFLGGATIAFIAALLTIVDRILSLRERYRTPKPSATVVKLRSEPPAEGASYFQRLPFRFPWFRRSPLSFLLYREIGIIGGAGLLLNYMGLALSLRLESLLFLDMTGTALVAFLLGPWWGAFVALLSSSAVNWLLFPGPGAETLIFPWSLVNMAGALFWGALARTSSFQRYLETGHMSVVAHVWFLVRLGVLGGMVMAIPGTFVEAAISGKTGVALHGPVVGSFQPMIVSWQFYLQAQFSHYFQGGMASSLAWGIVHWIQSCLQYIPDKTVSVSIALVFLKYGFPLFERELIHGVPKGRRPTDSSFAPLVLGLLYIPSSIALLSSDVFSPDRYWLLWSAPWVIIVCGWLKLMVKGQSRGEVQEARLNRADRYYDALKPIEREPSYQFCRRLTLATLIATAIVALCLPVFLSEFGSVAFHFFIVVYGFLLAMHLIHVAISQNLSIARTGGFATVDPLTKDVQPERPRPRRATVTTGR